MTKRKRRNLDKDKRDKVQEATRDEKLDIHASKALVTYGKSVIEERALPDYRDGLKPVNRKILWAMYKVVNARPDKGYIKAARVVGQTMSYFHPHGDMAIYNAMVNMTNSPQRIDNTSLTLILGQGNWGWFNSSPAASRYTECKLSYYSDRVLLDPEYLEVIDKVSNFDGSTTEPLILPSKLPTLLFRGTSGVAVGTTTNIPPFKPEGVVKLVRKALRGRKITPRLCLRSLEFNYPYGAVCDSKDQEILEYFKNGTGTLYFGCDYSVDEKNREIVITGLRPDFKLDTLQDKLLNKTEIVEAVDDNSDRNGIKITIKLKNSVPQREVAERFEEINNPLFVSKSFQTNVTVRRVDESVETAESTAEFKQTTIPDLIEDWVKWRVELETAYLKNRRTKLQNQIAYQELLKYAISKLDVIFEVLKSKTSDYDQKLAKRLKISEDEARTILNLQVRRLSNMSKSDIDKKLNDLTSDLKQVRADLKQPESKVLRELDDIAQHLYGQ